MAATIVDSLTSVLNGQRQLIAV